MDIDFDPSELARCMTAAPFLIDPDDLSAMYPNKPINIPLDRPSPKQAHQSNRLIATQTT